MGVLRHWSSCSSISGSVSSPVWFEIGPVVFQKECLTRRPTFPFTDVIPLKICLKHFAWQIYTLFQNDLAYRRPSPNEKRKKKTVAFEKHSDTCQILFAIKKKKERLISLMNTGVKCVKM